MFDNHSSMVRQVGVRVAEHVSTEQVPAMTIASISDVEFKYMKWGDEQGKAHEGLVLTAKDADGTNLVFYPPNTEAWFKSCKAFSKDIQKQFDERMKARDAAEAKAEREESKYHAPRR